MAFNLQTFKTRTLTAIVFAIVMVTGLLLNQWSFIILFAVIHFGCWWEFIKILKKINPEKFRYYLPLGLLYISLPIFLMFYLRFALLIHVTDNYSKIIPCMIIFSIWINDTMAYIVGSLIGKTPFSKISAKKTWEGTIGGVILCVAAMALISWWLNFNVIVFTVIAAICAVFGTLGDLLESKLKRLAQIKDSGNILPGHGGFLDRFDSLLIATPFVWLYLYFFMG
ncbi:MAG: phosphatidate cytidylyltransferase [Chitinophagaceae bacterium]